VARERRNIQAANQQIEEAGPNETAKAEIKKLKDQAAALFLEAETFAEDGKFDESKVKLDLAEGIKKRAGDWEEKARAARTEDVCEVCGSRMESGDPSKAKFRHEDGKIHAGFVKIRRWLTEIRKRVREREERGETDNTTRRGSDRDRDRNRERSRSRDRDRNRDRRGRDRDRGSRGAEEQDRSMATERPKDGDGAEGESERPRDRENRACRGRDSQERGERDRSRDRRRDYDGYDRGSKDYERGYGYGHGDRRDGRTGTR